MATQLEQVAFIKEIAPHAQMGYKTIGKVLPSVCIGMACVESGYGTSKTMRNHNAFFGQKVGSGKTATKYWQGAFYTSKTKEEYTVGTHTVITSAFRAYPSMQMSVFNYYELLNTSLYKRVQANVPYSMQMQQIKLCGYMTSSTEVNSVVKIIERFGLTRYDHDQVVPALLPTYPEIRFGSTGPYVIAWQTYLNLHGAYLTVDGIFGSKTLDAVKKWETKQGFYPDGIISTEEWKIAAA
ncbi:MAG: glucosaminidase domain-containing protein [Lachnospiraceae bacterium]|nr:glucosaminidase domain-containing protein [Lachnospiraceae bacterium]